MDENPYKAPLEKGGIRSAGHPLWRELALALAVWVVGSAAVLLVLGSVAWLLAQWWD
jgi:hypothetical protein